MKNRIDTDKQPLAKQYYVCKSCKTRFLNKTTLLKTSVQCPACGSRETVKDQNVMY